jgi:hypothetical protein
MRWRTALLFTIGCSSAPSHSSPVTPPAPPPADAAVAAVEPDAGIPQAVFDAPLWVFRYSTTDRTSIWNLRYADGHALLIVDNSNPHTEEDDSGTVTPVYYGTATEGETLKIDVTTGTARMTLDCKRAKRSLSKKCNDTKAKAIDVLECFHPDFKTPMTFGLRPGVEYVVDASCTGYRLAK